MLGKKHNPETIEKMRQDKLGAKNPNWNGGRRIHEQGYSMILESNNRYVMEHRIIMENYLGRKLKQTEVVHHKDGDPKNNRIENLMLFENQSKHNKFHQIESPRRGLK